MNEEARDNLGEQEVFEAVERFKKSLLIGEKQYFDVSVFEGIIESLLEEGDVETSELAVLQAIQIHPYSLQLQIKHAQILLNNGKIQKALENLKMVEKIEHTNPDVYLLQGTAYTINGDLKKATKAFRLAIGNAVEEELDEIYYHIGTAFIHTGNIELAVEYMEKAYMINPENESVLYELGFFYEQLDETAKSIKFYNKYLDIDPFNSIAWYNIGIAYNKFEKYEKALEAYDYALALNDTFLQSDF